MSKQKHLPRGTVNTSVARREPIQFDRLTHCPETGIDLDTVDIKKHVHTLWPTIDERQGAYAEAMRRRDHLMHEYNARQIEGGMHRAND